MDVRLSVKVGDLVRRKKPKGYWRHESNEWLAVIVEIKESNGYEYPKFMVVGTGKIESCCYSLLEIISESK